MEAEKREEERKAQQVELKSLESLIYKYRRDDVVKQNQPLLDKLTALLEWVEGDGQFACLEETKSNVEEIKEGVSFLNRFIMFSNYFTDLDDLTKASSPKKRAGPPESRHSPYSRAMPLYAKTQPCSSSTSISRLSWWLS